MRNSVGIRVYNHYPNKLNALIYIYCCTNCILKMLTMRLSQPRANVNWKKCKLISVLNATNFWC